MLRQIFGFADTALIDAQITKILSRMDEVEVDSEEYPKLMDRLERLNKIKAEERPGRVSRDTVVMVAGNLLGILVIVAYEQKHVFTSKGLTQLIRLKGQN